MAYDAIAVMATEEAGWQLMHFMMTDGNAPCKNHKTAETERQTAIQL